MAASRKKLWIAGGLAAVVAAIPLGIVLSFYLRLPAPGSLAGSSLDQAFKNFEVQGHQKVSFEPRSAGLSCALCYPKSEHCVSAQTNWISGSLLNTPSNNLIFNVKRAFLNTAIQWRYSKSDIESLYLAFGARLLGAVTIDAYCSSTFGRACGEISLEDSANLALKLYRGPAVMETSESYIAQKSDIEDRCK